MHEHRGLYFSKEVGGKRAPEIMGGEQLVFGMGAEFLSFGFCIELIAFDLLVDACLPAHLFHIAVKTTVSNFPRKVFPLNL